MKKNRFAHGQLRNGRAVLLPVVISLVLSGCMSLYQADEKEIDFIITAIKVSDSDALAEMSATPFLLDSEILPTGAMTADFWNGLTSAGFSLDNAVITENRPAKADDYVLFGRGTDVKTFFDKYLPDNSLLVSLAADRGEVNLLLGPLVDGSRNLIGWGGPK